MIWTLGALILLLVILVAIRVVRGLTFGTFVAGGRNRKTRLAVMDATAVDSHRRLVLVRRDDVEHLILIGGPTDVVVEQNIRLQTPSRRPLAAETRPHGGDLAPRQAPESLKPPPAAAEPPPEPAPKPKAAEPSQAAAPLTRTTSPYRPSTQSPAQPSTQTPAAAVPKPPSSASPATPAAGTAAEPGAAAATQPAGGKSGDMDDELLKELEVTLGERSPAQQNAPKPEKVDDEMSRLLGELSTERDKPS